MDVLKDWISGDQACVEGNGISDWKSLEYVKSTQLVPIIDETEDLGSGKKIQHPHIIWFFFFGEEI